jgi:transcriptional regulator with XRE-family HTH domain
MAIRYYEVPKTFQEWRIFSRYTLEECQRIFKVNKRTIKNWESGKTKPPQAVLICLQLFAGRLDFLGKEWKGFRITPECIESPEGDFVRAWEIRALRYAMQALDIMRNRRINNVEKDIVFIDELAKMRKDRLSTKSVHKSVNENAQNRKQQGFGSD